MNKKSKILIICIIILLITVIGIVIWKISTNTNIDSDVIYTNTFYFSMGSRRLKIYQNGDVYDDLEIEEPNHKVNYKKIKTLNSTQIEELKLKIENELNREKLENYVKLLVYGKTSIDPMSLNLPSSK